MDKPKTRVKKAHNYQECSEYLEKKYNYDERDYAGKYKFLNSIAEKVIAKYGDSWYSTPPANMTPEQHKAYDLYVELMKDEPPYQDFWHWVCDNYQIHNGCYITFSKETLDEMEEGWEKEIYKHYIDEFGDKNGEVEMWCDW